MEQFNMDEARKVLNRDEYHLYAYAVDLREDDVNVNELKDKMSRIKQAMSRARTMKMQGRRSSRINHLMTGDQPHRRRKMNYLFEANKMIHEFVKKITQPLSKSTNEEEVKKAVAQDFQDSIKVSMDSKAYAEEQNLHARTQDSKILRSGLERKQGHSSSRNKRFQGRKDAR